MSSEYVKILTDSNYTDEVSQNPLPVLIDFWAEWCGPCRALTPTIEAYAKDNAGKVAVYKMNVDENAETPVKFGVRSIPTLVILKNGQKVEQVIGAVPRASIEAAVAKAL